MKLVSVDQITGGMVLAQNVYTLDDQLVLPKGTVLDDKAIKRIRNYSIYNVFIEDSGNIAKTVVPVRKDISYAKNLTESAEFKQFKKALENDASSLETALKSTFKSKEPITTESLVSPVMVLFDNNETGAGIFDMLHNMRKYDDAIYMHSINVALISNMIGRWMRKSEDEIKTITMAGLVHDIGKLVIPQDILTKSTGMSRNDLKIYRTHPQLGYQLIRDSDLDTHIKNTVLMHHERADGSGFPFGIRGEQIDEIARIIAVADTYDDLTGKRSYRDGASPFLVIEAFEKEGLIKYDADVILTFLNHIANTFLANRVRLSNDLEGEVIYINPDHLSRPTVKCGDSFIDLSRIKDVYIKDII